MQSFFTINRPLVFFVYGLVFFVYGLVFFVLGLTITFQSRQHSRLILARRLNWLAFFGYIHALHEWGFVFIPLQATYLPPPIIDLLRAIQLAALAISFTCLFQFGVDLLRPMPNRWWVWLPLLPLSLLILWTIAAAAWFMLIPIPLNEWYLLADIWARYLLGIPAASLAAYGLHHNSAQLIAPLTDTQTLRMVRLAKMALVGYAVMIGAVISPEPYLPAHWLNNSWLENFIAIPVPIYRSLFGFILTIAIVRALEIFDVEISRQLMSLEEAHILTTERDRIGRDLHDRTLQSVYATGLLLNVTQELLAQSQVEAATQNLTQAMTTLDQAITDIRGHIVQLHNHSARVNLAEGLTQLAHNSVLTSMVEFKINLNLPENESLPTAQINHILVIIGEALSNVARHAHAKQVQLTAQIEGGILHLSVIDDGRGIPLDYVAGYGLQNMHDRTRMIGGELTIHSRAGQGTRLQLTIPWTETK